MHSGVCSCLWPVPPPRCPDLAPLPSGRAPARRAPPPSPAPRVLDARGPRSPAPGREQSLRGRTQTARLLPTASPAVSNRTGGRIALSSSCALKPRHPILEPGTPVWAQLGASPRPLAAPLPPPRHFLVLMGAGRVPAGTLGPGLAAEQGWGGGPVGYRNLRTWEGEHEPGKRIAHAGGTCWSKYLATKGGAALGGIRCFPRTTPRAPPAPWSPTAASQLLGADLAGQTHAVTLGKTGMEGGEGSGPDGSSPLQILSFPRNLLSPSETRRGLAAAFRMWSDVSPFSFREVAPELPSDFRIGFYPVNHTDCLTSALHHCFDGPTGELAHAFFPPHGGIHFDDSEYWVLGPTRYSWKKGVWLTDLVHVAAHEIGHALGLMHSQHVRALMHLNATLRGWKALSQDEMWGLHRLYGCLDRLFVCASWARKGFCDARRRLMKRLCPSSCDFCYEFPFPTVAATPPPPRTKTRLVPEGRNVTFRCGQKILHKKGKVYWYKDQEPLEFSYPGYLALGEAHLSIIANAINEGTYTCEVRRRQRVLTTYSWRIRVRS
ncbi:matrix metalloproteinase-23 [Trichechus manatus latirostris]|uniref:Matrix metalloproteinase-23 n=1 Tax=Trichechus manatus latirostris TaxID=127582 RepID=A0A2Y9E017_TRIMA|nr:matrix metalloproteinase-23 [Trichechus manatus latirostris]